MLFNVGETVGFQLEFIEGQGVLSVYKNGVRLLDKVSHELDEYRRAGVSGVECF